MANNLGFTAAFLLFTVDCSVCIFLSDYVFWVHGAMRTDLFGSYIYYAYASHPAKKKKKNKEKQGVNGQKRPFASKYPRVYKL